MGKCQTEGFFQFEKYLSSVFFFKYLLIKSKVLIFVMDLSVCRWPWE